MTASNVVQWISGQPIALGIFAVVLGAVIAFCGKRWFPWIAGVYAGLCVVEFVVLGSAHYGGMNGALPATLTLVIALAIAIPVGMLIRRHVWFAVGLNGIMYGACFGAFIHTLILAASGWWSLPALVELFTCEFL